MEIYFVEDISYSITENHYRIVIESSGDVLFDIDCLDYNDLVAEMNKEGFIEIKHNIFIRNNSILTLEEIKFVVDLKLYEKDELFILEVMEQFKIMGKFDNLKNIILNFISNINSYIRAKLKKECKEKGLSPMRETFKLLISDVDNLNVYFGAGTIEYIKKYKYLLKFSERE